MERWCVDHWGSSFVYRSFLNNKHVGQELTDPVTESDVRRPVDIRGGLFGIKYEASTTNHYRSGS